MKLPKRDQALLRLPFEDVQEVLDFGQMDDGLESRAIQLRLAVASKFCHRDNQNTFVTKAFRAVFTDKVLSLMTWIRPRYKLIHEVYNRIYTNVTFQTPKDASTGNHACDDATNPSRLSRIPTIQCDGDEFSNNGYVYKRSSNRFI